MTQGQEGNVRFVRINGRIVPIRGKAMQSGYTTKKPGYKRVEMGTFERASKSIGSNMATFGVSGGLSGAMLGAAMEANQIVSTMPKSAYTTQAGLKSLAKPTLKRVGMASLVGLGLGSAYGAFRGAKNVDRYRKTKDVKIK